MLKEIIGKESGLGYTVLENSYQRLLLDVAKFENGEALGLVHRIEITRAKGEKKTHRKDYYRNHDENHPGGFGPVLQYEGNKLTGISFLLNEISNVDQFKENAIRSEDKLLNIVDLSNHAIRPRIEDSVIYTEAPYGHDVGYNGVIVSEQNEGKDKCFAILKSGYFWGFVGFEVDGKLLSRTYYEDDLFPEEFEELSDRSFLPYGDFLVFHK